MSKQVDERVVSMQFDNANFEKNVSQSMSTLEKFKRSLNFSGANKGLEDINAAAGNASSGMGGLGGAASAVGMKFSALQVVAVTALANITNSAINAGKKLVSSLTIDNVAAGWQKFSDKTTSVATLVAQGNAIEDVNNQLSRLMWFTDETSYNFTEMVSNIAKFTASGKDLESSVTAMEGIATWAALSGQNATTASRAMYQLSQAMSAGYMRLEDYKSIQNASMDTEEFRQKTLDAAVALGTLKKNSDGTYQSTVKGATKAKFTLQQFTTQLTSGMWMTSDVMMDVFETYAGAVDSIYETAEEKGKLASEIIDEIYETAEKKSISTDEAIKLLGYDFDSFALKAFEAAQKARTFKDAIDSVKDALSTSWMNIFENVFGDAEEATELWTDLANTLYDVFVEPINSLGEMIDGGLGKSFEKLLEPVKSLRKGLEGVTEPIKETVRTFEEYKQVIAEIIDGVGGWGEGQERWDALTKAGYDWATVQNIVNECLGDSTRHQTDYVLSIDEATDSTEDAIKADADYIATLATMSDAQLEALGLTEKQIAAIKEIKKQADKLGISVKEFVENVDELTGRSVLINSFKNIWAALVKVFDAVKKAWQDVFPPKTSEQRAQMLYDIIAAFHKFTTKLIMSEETAEKVTRTFRGLFAILKLVKDIVSGGLTFAYRILNEVLKYFNLNIWDVTAAIGDVVYSIFNWLDSLIDVSGILDVIVPIIRKVGDAIVNWIDAFKNSEGIQNMVKYVKEFAETIKNWFKSLKDSENLAKTIAEGIVGAFVGLPALIGKILSGLWSGIIESFGGDASFNPFSSFAEGIKTGLQTAINTVGELGKALLKQINKFLDKYGFKQISTQSIQGLLDGLSDGAKTVWNTVVKIFETLIEKVKSVLGIHSPSKVFFAIGGFIIAGLVLGLQNGGSEVLTAIKGVFQPAINWIKSLDWGSIFSAAVLATTSLSFYKIADALQSLTAPLKGLRDIFSSAAYVMKKSAKSISKVIKSFAKVLSGVAFDLRADAIKKIATALLMLVGALAILTFFDTKDLIKAGVTLAVLAGILIGLTVVMNIINKSSVEFDKGKFTMSKITSGLVSISIALLIMSLTLKILGKMDLEQAEKGFKVLAGCVIALIAVIAAFGLFCKGDAAANVGAFGTTMTKIGIALLLMAVAIKMIGKMDYKVLDQGLKAVAKLSLLIMALMAATRLCGNSFSTAVIGKTLLGVGVAIGVLMLAVRILGKMSEDELEKGTAAVYALGALMVGLMAATRVISGKDMTKVGITILAVAGSIALLAGVAILCNYLSWGGFAKGVAMIAIFGGMIVGLIAATRLAGDSFSTGTIGLTLLAVAGAIAIIAGIAVLLSLVPWENFAKGATMVAIFGGMIVGLMAATKLIGNGADMAKLGMTLLMASGAIAILAGVAILLGLVSIENLIKGVVAVSIFGGLVIAMIAVAKNMQGCQGAIGTIAMMIALVAAMGLVVLMLAKLAPDTALPSAIALTILILAMTGVMAALKAIGTDITTALKNAIALTTMAIPLLALVGVLWAMNGLDASLKNVLALIVLAGAMTLLVFALSKMSLGVEDIVNLAVGIVALTAMFVPLMAFVVVLRSMSGVKNAVENALALTILAAACTLLLIPLMLIGALVAGPQAIALGAGILALTATVISLFALVGVLWAMNGLKNAQENVNALTQLLTVITGMLVVLALVGPLALVGVGALAALTAVIVAVGSMAVVIGGLMEKIPCLEDFLDKGIEVLIKIAEGLGTMIGAFLGSIGERLGDALVKIAEDIKEFVDTLAEAAESAGTIKAESFDGIKELMAVLLELGGTSIATGIMDKLSMMFNKGEDSLDAFRKSGVKFFKAMGKISKAAEEVDIDVDAMEDVLDAAKKLAEFQSCLEPIGGVISFFTGHDDLGTFGINAAIFVRSMVNAFGKLTDDRGAAINFNTDGMETILDAAKKLAEFQSVLNPIGGVVTWFSGRDDLGEFGKNAKTFVTKMVEAFGKVTDEDGRPIDFNTNGMQTILDAAKKLAEFQSTLSPIGGVITWFAGRDDLEKFGDKVAKFVEAMAYGFSQLSDGKRGIYLNVDGMGKIIEAAEKLSTLQKSLPAIGGIINWLAGEKKLKKFGKQVKSFVKSMVTAFEALTPEGTRELKLNTTGMEAVIKAGNGMTEVFAAIQRLTNSNENGITGDLGSFGSDIASFVKNVVEAYKPLRDTSGNDLTFNTEGLDQVAYAGERLVSLQGSLQDVQNAVKWFHDLASIGDYGTNVGVFIENIARAYSAISEVDQNGNFTAKFNDEGFEIIAKTGERLSGLQDTLQGIKNSASLWRTVATLGNFGNNVRIFIQQIATAYSAISELDGDGNFKQKFNTEGMDAIISAGERLGGLQGTIQDIVDSAWDEVELGDFGTNVKDFVENIVIAYSALRDDSGNDLEFNTAGMDTVIDGGRKLLSLQSEMSNIRSIMYWYEKVANEDFGNNIRTFIHSIQTAYAPLKDSEGKNKTFNTQGMNNVVSAARMLLKLPSEIPDLTNAIEFFSRDTDFHTFGTRAAEFIKAMRTAYSALVDGDGNSLTFDINAMKALVTAAGALAELEAKLEPINGVISWFSGQTNLEEFGEKIYEFGKAMNKLRTAMGEKGFSAELTASIKEVGNIFVALQEALPDISIIDKVAGKMSLSDFAVKIYAFAVAMGMFSKKASEIDESAIDVCVNAAYRIKDFIETLNNFDISGVGLFTGIGTGGLGADGPAYQVAKAIVKFCNTVKGIDLDALYTSVTAAVTLRDLINGLHDLDTSGIENFTPDVIGSKIKSYYNAIGNVDASKLAASVTAATKLKDFIQGLAGLNTSGVGTFKAAVEELSTISIDEVIQKFSGSASKLKSAGADLIKNVSEGMLSKKSEVTRAAKTIASSATDAIESENDDFYNAGATLAEKLANGLKSGKTDVESAGSALASAAEEGINGKYDSFYSAGSYLVDGFSSGISSNTFKATATAVAMAKAAIDAAKEKLKINSPSKVFKAIGSGIPEGFALGIDTLGNKVDNSVDAMASTAINSARSAMATVLEAMSGDMDAQPTIRPVVDLSDVKTGVDAIGGLFASTQSVGVQSNLGAINVAMNRRLQNGSNDDIISAINKLGNGLENNRGDTYNIDGITYSNGNEISEAVQTLVRAAQVGRRV